MRGIPNIVIGVVFVAGGLSGQLALLGTSSPTALAVLGGALVVWGVYQRATDPGDG